MTTSTQRNHPGHALWWSKGNDSQSRLNGVGRTHRGSTAGGTQGCTGSMAGGTHPREVLLLGALLGPGLEEAPLEHLPAVDLLLNRAAGDQAVHDDLALLPDAVRAVHAMRYNRRGSPARHPTCTQPLCRADHHDAHAHACSAREICRFPGADLPAAVVACCMAAVISMMPKVPSCRHSASQGPALGQLLATSEAICSGPQV
jgi:hypothetical protein